MKIWLIEDDGFKRDKIRACLTETFPLSHVHEAKSAKSAFNFLRGGAPDLIVLDMSLPTFDIGPTEAGGRPQGFGGVEFLREMDRKNVIAPVVVVTQYEVFGEERVSINELATRLATEHAGTFSALIFYEPASERWKTAFKTAIVKATDRGTRKQ